MEENPHSAPAAVKPASKCTSTNDSSTLLGVDADEADEQLGESRVGTPGRRARGLWKAAWIGGALLAGAVIGALVLERSSAAPSPDPRSVSQLREVNSEAAAGPVLSEGAVLLLKSALSGFYLHVSAGQVSGGKPVFHRDSTSDGSKWLVEYVGGSDSQIMLRNNRSRGYLHVSAQSMHEGDSVVHLGSTSDGSKWQVEHANVGSSDSTIMLKSVRSGFYLHADLGSTPFGCPTFLHHKHNADGSNWLLEPAVM